jgi:hypothetical protein
LNGGAVALVAQIRVGAFAPWERGGQFVKRRENRFATTGESVTSVPLRRAERFVYNAADRNLHRLAPFPQQRPMAAMPACCFCVPTLNIPPE